MDLQMMSANNGATANGENNTQYTTYPSTLHTLRSGMQAVKSPPKFELQHYTYQQTRDMEYTVARGGSGGPLTTNSATVNGLGLTKQSTFLNGFEE